MEKNNKEVVVWHEFDGPGDTSIEVLEKFVSCIQSASAYKLHHK